MSADRPLKRLRSGGSSSDDETPSACCGRLMMQAVQGELRELREKVAALHVEIAKYVFSLFGGKRVACRVFSSSFFFFCCYYRQLLSE
jgi:hypothetical protein